MKWEVAFVLLTIFVACLQAADLDATCSADDSCIASNSYCRKDYTNCQDGKCKCKDGYSASGSNTCLRDKGYDEMCDSSSICLYGSTCSSSSTGYKCQCPAGKNFNTDLNLCVTSGLKAIGQECSAVSDCYTEVANAVECVANSGTASPKYCRCKLGYILDRYKCRIPHVDEACASSPGCKSMVEGLSSQETEVCSNLQCRCPATADKISINFQEITYTLCFTKNSANKADGESCTANNECSRRLCETCPSSSGKTCLVPASGAADLTVFPAILALLTVTIRMLC